MAKPSQIVVELSGSGTGLIAAEVRTAGDTQYRGRLLGVVIREEAGGLATQINEMAFVHNSRNANVDLTTPAQPPQEHVLTLLQNIALTPSATAASFSSTIDTPRVFSDGLAIIASITASGAYTLRVALEVEEV